MSSAIFVAPVYSVNSFSHSVATTSRRQNFWVLLFLVVFVAVINLVVAENFAPILVGMLVTCMLMPGVLIAMKSNSAAIKLFILTLFGTQVIGAPAFVVNRGAYTYAGWLGVKDFTFSLRAFFEVYLPVALFFLCIPIFFVIFRCAFSGESAPASARVKSLSRKIQNGITTEICFTFAIILLVILHVWMFRYRIGMVGVLPPRLPVHMSGILSYATRFLIPFLIVYFYAKSSRSLYLSILLLMYAFVLGLSQVSRSSGMFIILPIVLFALLDKKHLIVGVALIWAALCIQFATLMREIVYEGLTLSSGDALSLLDAGWQLFSDLKFSPELFTAVPLAILNRIESPQNLVLGHQFNADAVGGIAAVLLSLFREGMGGIDSRAYTFEWCGLLIFDGYGFRGGVLSNIVIAYGAGIAWLLLATTYVTGCLFVIEKLARRIGVRFASYVSYWATCIVGVLLVLLAMGTTAFWGFFVLCLAFAFAPSFDVSVRGKAC